jgi:hypothetical protein
MTWLWGSLTFMHSLLEAGAVDEIRMLVCRASRGRGTGIFDDRHDLRLIAADSYDNGLAILRCAIQK